MRALLQTARSAFIAFVAALGMVGLATAQYYAITNAQLNGHIISALNGAPAPTVTGTNCTTHGVSAGSTDAAGTFTNGTATTGCIIVFGTAYNTAPNCVVVDNTTPADSGSGTVTAAHIALGTIVSGDVISYFCTAIAGN